MPLHRVKPATIQLFVQATGLLLAGIALEAAFVAAEARVPPRIYSETSYTLSLLTHTPMAVLPALLSLALVCWAVTPTGRARLGWHQIDSVGGLRWPIFALVAMLAWAYSGHGYNYYFGQAHLWDRLLLVLLMFGTLRSPVVIAVFCLELVVSRAQFNHPINSLTPIGDELPIRVLGVVVGCSLWNALLSGLESHPATSRAAFVRNWSGAARVQTRTLVYSILCLVGSYYAFAGMNKVLIGENLTDWLRFSHMENLFVASHLNGWHNQLSEARVVEVADRIRAIGVPIGALTLLFELGMSFVLLRQRGTLLLLAAISSMHVGIVIMTGVIFWKWMALDLALLGWLWFWRRHEEVRRLYSRSNFIVSLLLIAALIAVFHHNRFTWWNTKWIKVYEIEASDEAGNRYLVDYADFSPYILLDFCEPAGSKVQTRVYGSSRNQDLMQRLESVDPIRLRQFSASRAVNPDGDTQKRQKRDLEDFIGQHFKHRNADPGRRVLPFLWPPPALHNRHLRAPNLYRGQAPVVEVRVRFVEIFYSGSKLHRVREEIVHTIRIPADL